MSRARWRIGVIADPLPLDQAALWVERMRAAPDDAVCAAFADWRAADPAHAAAYRRADAAREAAARAADAPSLAQMRHDARARAERRRTARSRLRRWGMGGALLLVGAPLAAWGIGQSLSVPIAAPAIEQRAATLVGERRRIALPDGSAVLLDTASRLSVRFDAGERRVAIDGQAWFDVRPDTRPFVVAAGGRTIVAEPGGFDVRVDGGVVRALASRGTLRMDGVPLAAGQQLAAAGDRVAIRRADAGSPLATWRDGIVQFEDARLDEAVAELNRYRRRPIRLADRDAAGLRLSGSFRTAQGPAFIDAVTARFPLVVAHETPASITLASR